MSNELAIPTAGDILTNHVDRLVELERRVLTLGDEPPEEGGCCGVLCCNDNPSDTLATGESFDYCAVTLEESPGEAIRLAFNGFVVVQASSSGVVQFDVTAIVAAQAYLERATWRQTLAANDIVTVPMTNTIDTAAAAPVSALRVRNLGSPSIVVLAVNLRVDVYGIRDGSTACGEIAGTG